MLFKMNLESVKWSGEEGECFLCFSNLTDGTKLKVEVPEPIGFDIITLLNQRLSGNTPYFGISDLISQVGGKVEKLTITKQQSTGSGIAQISVGQKIFSVELFFADIVSIAAVEGIPIYFDESICQKNATSLDKRLLFTHTTSITKYSFETDA